jgi:hypothetical protein
MYLHWPLQTDDRTLVQLMSLIRSAWVVTAAGSGTSPTGPMSLRSLYAMTCTADAGTEPADDGVFLTLCILQFILESFWLFRWSERVRHSV